MTQDVNSFTFIDSEGRSFVFAGLQRDQEAGIDCVRFTYAVNGGRAFDCFEWVDYGNDTELHSNLKANYGAGAQALPVAEIHAHINKWLEAQPTGNYPKTAKIRSLNDALRKERKGGNVVFAGALAQADLITKAAVYAAVAMAGVPADGNDPYGEADFGQVVIDGKKYLWKIDYYDKAMEYGSEDPSDPEITHRVLSIFHAEDY